MTPGETGPARGCLRSRLAGGVLAVASTVAAVHLGVHPAAGTASVESAAARLELAPSASGIVVDGVLDEDAWRSGTRVSDLVSVEPGVRMPADLWLAADDSEIFLAIRLSVPGGSPLLTRATPRADGDTLAPLDDSIEVWLVTDDGEKGAEGLHLVFNGRAARWDARGRRRGGRWSWDARAAVPAHVATTVRDGLWESEVSIPRAAIRRRGGEPVDRFRILVVRQARRPSVRYAWPAIASPEDPLRDGAIVEVRRDPIVAALSATELLVRNGGATPRDLRVSAGPDPGCAKVDGRALRLDGGARARVRLPEACAGEATMIEVAGAGDGAVRFRAPRRPRSRAASHADARTRSATRGVGLETAYHPYRRMIRWRLDASAASPPLPDSTVRVRVSRVEDGAVVADAEAEIAAAGVVTADLALPQLEAGRHRVTVEIAAGGERPLVLQRSFLHRTYGWEHNELGMQPEVIPPFEPLRREGRDVHAVLRRYRVGDVGLPDEIDSLGTPLLAGPLRYEVRLSEGEALPAAVEPVRFTRETGGVVAYEAKWRAGGLVARARGRIEVDGFVWIDLELPEQPEVTIERLDLVLPMREDVARLMNAVTDRTRHNFSGEVPAGRGEVWASADAERVEIAGTLAPYLWLGDGTRGVAFVAPGTRDWVVPGDESIETVEREQGVVLVRVQLVGRPTRLDRARVLSFGIQATPTKPQVLEPSWRLWQPRCETVPPVRSLCILATSWEWGGATAYGDFYPAPGNEGILDALATARREGRVADGEVQRWLERREPESASQQVRSSLALGFRVLAARPDAVVAYVNAHNVGPIPEFEVYQDEWSPNPFADRDRAPLSVDELHQTFPTRSWQDFALWHLAKLLDSGAVDGFYFDNTYLRAVFDEISGAAHRDDTGALRPVVDLLEMRSFLRRAQTLAYTKRGRWLNVSHMTNTPIAPVHTWSAAILDGEMRYGPRPFGERFSREWIRSEALGSQVGSLPIFLPGVVGTLSEARREELELSVVAGAAIHEIRVWGGSSRLADRVWGPLHRFGYGRADVDVYRYWDPRPPFQVSGADADALLVVRGSHAMALVAGFGEGGDVTLRIDHQALGLDESLPCRDASTGRALAAKRDSACRFRLADDGFRLISWTGD